MLRTTLLGLLSGLFMKWSLTLGAPMKENESPVTSNFTLQCFQDALNEKLKMQFQSCIQNGSVEQTDIVDISMGFLCALKAEEMVTREGDIDVTKLKRSLVDDEDDDGEKEQQDEEEMRERDHMMAMTTVIEKCEMEKEEEMAKVNDLIRCIVKSLSMNCTLSPMEEEMTVAEEK